LAIVYDKMIPPRSDMPPTKDHEACPFARALTRLSLCFPVVAAGACERPHADNRTIGAAHRDEHRHRHVKIAPAAAAITAGSVSVREELAERIEHD